MADIKWNHRNLQLLLRRKAISEDLFRRTKAIADACNAASGDAGYLALRSTQSRRGRAAVVAVRTKARRDNAKNNTMIRNLDAGK